VLLEHVVQHAEERDDAAEDLAEERARHAVPGADEHELEDDAGHCKSHIEICCHELEVLEQVRGLLRADQHCAAGRADQEVRRVDEHRLAGRAEQRLRDDLRDHHDGNGPARADDVDERGLEDSECHPGRPLRVDVCLHHFSYFFVLF